MSYYAAVSLTRVHEFGAAIKEINTCRPYFQKPDSNCYQRVGLELLTGHIFQIYGKIKRARNITLNAYKIAKSGKIGKNMILSTLINLTQMEYICGNFSASIRFAQKTLRKIPLNEGITNRYILIRTLLAAYIGIGNLSKAMVYGQKLLELGKKLNSTPRVAFARLMQAYLYELYGQPAISNQTWKIWNEERIADEFALMFPTFIQVKVTGLVFQGSLNEASSFLTKAIEKMSGTDGKLESKQFFVHQLMIQGLLKKKLRHDDALSVFQKAKSISQNIDSCFEKNLLIVIMGSLFPRLISNKELSRVLKTLLIQKAYDPLWYLYANELNQREVAGGKQYLQYNIEKTNAALITKLQTQLPVLRRLVSKFNKNENERTVLLIQSGKSTMLMLEDFKQWHPAANVFFFDIANGKWSYHKREGIIKPGTNTHRIFSALLLVKNNRINLRNLYQTVWGGQFEPETDKLAAKAALIRCKKELKVISSTISLDWEKKDKANLEISLKITVPWATFL